MGVWMHKCACVCTRGESVLCVEALQRHVPLGTTIAVCVCVNMSMVLIHVSVCLCVRVYVQAHTFGCVRVLVWESQAPGHLQAGLLGKKQEE